MVEPGSGEPRCVALCNAMGHKASWGVKIRKTNLKAFILDTYMTNALDLKATETRHQLVGV